MARASGTEPTLDLRPLIQMVGIEQVIDQLGRQRVLEAMGGLERVLEEFGPEKIASALTPEQREELKRLL